MSTVKAGLWSISNEPIPLKDVRITGDIEDFNGCFTIVQTYQSRKNQQKAASFQYWLYDLGLVTDFKAVVNGETVSTNVIPTEKLEKSSESIVKQYFNSSSTDTFVCRLSEVPPESEIEIHLSFAQTLRLDGPNSLLLTLPTTVTPRQYFHEEKNSEFSSSLRQFTLNVDLKMLTTYGAITGLRSPSHPFELESAEQKNVGRIKLAKIEESISDSDLVIFIDVEHSPKGADPRVQIQKSGDNTLLMVSMVPQFEVPYVEVAEDDEEGHPDVREVLVLIDTNQTELEEAKMVLQETLKQVDLQNLFNFIILGKNKLHKMFHKSQPADTKAKKEATTWLEEQFDAIFNEVKPETPSLYQALTKVYDIDVVSEEIRRTMLFITKGQISTSSAVLEMEHDFTIFPLGIGHSVNHYVLNTLAKYTSGVSEVVYAADAEARASELTEKLKKQFQRINQPEFDDSILDWGHFKKYMRFQTPSAEDDAKMPNFYSGDILTFFGLTEGVPVYPTALDLSIKSKFIKDGGAEFKIPVDPKRDIYTGLKLPYFHLKLEREFPGDGAVREKKFNEMMVKNGVASGGSVFHGVGKVGNCDVVIVSASDTFEEEKTKAPIQYGRDYLLKLQPHHTNKPVDVILGEIEKGKPMAQHNSRKQRGGGKRANRERQKKLDINTQWEKGEFDVFFRTVNNLLNKITGENFEAMKAKLLAMRSQIESDFIALDVVVKLVFEKALSAPIFVTQFADLCVVLATELTKSLPNPEKNDGIEYNFRRLLLDHCKANFEVCFAPPDLKDPATLTTEERFAQEEKEFRRKARLGSNITFVGELYLRKLLRDQIIHHVIRGLFEEQGGTLGKPDPKQIELICKLMTTLGQRLEDAQHRQFSETIFSHLKKLSLDTFYDMRTRFMIQDLLDLRSAKWIPKKGKNGPAPNPKTVLESKTSPKINRSRGGGGRGKNDSLPKRGNNLNTSGGWKGRGRQPQQSNRGRKGNRGRDYGGYSSPGFSSRGGRRGNRRQDDFNDQDSDGFSQRGRGRRRGGGGRGGDRDYSNKRSEGSVGNAFGALMDSDEPKRKGKSPQKKPQKSPQKKPVSPRKKQPTSEPSPAPSSGSGAWKPKVLDSRSSAATSAPPPDDEETPAPSSGGGAWKPKILNSRSSAATSAPPPDDDDEETPAPAPSSGGGAWKPKILNSRASSATSAPPPDDDDEDN